MNDNIIQCINYIKEHYKNIESLSLKDIVAIVLQWGENDAQEHPVEHYKWKLEQEKKQKELEASREDYKEEIDDEGKIWYHQTHWYHQRGDSRKLKPGDIIQYKADMPGYEGNEYGVILVNSFDFASDFACRCYFGIQITERYKKEELNKFIEDRNIENKEEPNISWISDSAPGIYAFSLATEKEIENFFKTIKEEWPEQYEFYFHAGHSFMPDYIKERYSQYINSNYGKEKRFVKH